MKFELGNKLYDKNSITLDGRLDEPVWQTATEFTNFRDTTATGGQLAKVQTSFKILPCEDRLYIGITCQEPDIDYVLEHSKIRTIFGADGVEVFLSPANTSLTFYQFIIAADNRVSPYYYEESGFTRPDPYAPVFKSATYAGEDYWSVELEIPFTALYMTRNTVWNKDWRFNVTRRRNIKGASLVTGGVHLNTWSVLNNNFFEPDGFNTISGFPVRAIEDDIYISSASAEMKDVIAEGYAGEMKVTTTNAVGGTFVFTSPNTDPITVDLEAGNNSFTVPCRFAEINRTTIPLTLTRVSDGKIFSRAYPVMVTYEPIKLRFSLPEYRNNFYPGQDYTKIVGTAKSEKPVTLKLVGPGIPEQTATPDENGNFSFATPGFEEGDAFLTASIDGFEITKKISRLAPTGHRMSWISGGNLIVDGEPVLRRNMYADRWRGGEVFRRRYNTEEQYQTPQVTQQKGTLRADELLPGSESVGGEAFKDIMPSEKLFRKMDETLEKNKDNDFAYYYLSDEPECRQVSPIYLRHLYEYLCEKDPYHVVLIASRNADTYVDCADWFETHPYLEVYTKPDGTRGYGRPINTLGRYVDDIVKLNRSDKCIGLLHTTFAYKFLTRTQDYPTFDEMIAHVWAAMIRGGKSLWPFAYMDLPDRAAMYEGNRYVFSSFGALQEFVLHAKRTTLVNTDEVEAVYYDLPDKKMFVLVNKVPEPQTVTLDAISGTWCEFRHARDITTNTFNLAPFEVVIGTSEDMSGDLPTYQEVKAICDNHDYKRTHSKSLLYERYDDMVVTTSGYNRSLYKMFDGVHDDLGFDHDVTRTQIGDFVQMDMTKIHPTFSKVVLSGWHLANTTILAGPSADALTELEIESVTSTEFSNTFVLKKPITADFLRFEFHEEKIEVYEIEIM